MTTPDVHFDMQDYGGPGVYFKTTNVTSGSAELNWVARLANDRERAAKVDLVVRLYDAQHKAVATVRKAVDLPAHAVTPVSLDAMLATPHLWQSVTDPYLYRSEIEIVSRAPNRAAVTRTDSPELQPPVRLRLGLGQRDL